jgi:Tetrahydrofolate dehydrogenase/cyclohydrolase, NAD(P)-binding domain
VVVGRSTNRQQANGLMLLQEGATVSICTSKTTDIETYTRRITVARSLPPLKMGDESRLAGAVCYAPAP